MESEKHIGLVVWFNNKDGFGFISRDDEKDIFVHWSDIKEDGNNYRTLTKDQKVEFSIGLNHKGEVKAVEVFVIAEPEE